jgi:hypothetical protein
MIVLDLPISTVKTSKTISFYNGLILTVSLERKCRWQIFVKSESRWAQYCIWRPAKIV